MDKRTLGVAVVALLVSIGGWFTTDTETVHEIVQDSVGAVTTLDGVDNPYTSIGGKQVYYYNQNMLATSSVLCSIKNPYNATSTLKNYTFQVTSNGIAVAQTLDVSTSSTAIASSSPAFVYAYQAGTAQFSGVWNGVATTTNTRLIGNKANNNIGDTDNIIGPSDYITLRIATGTPTSLAGYYTGTCNAVIEKL